MHEQLTEAGKILGLRVMDHIIVTKKGHFSFQDAGLMKG
jgi:DNA repair protein RadC